jgi:ketosteroid isomerase-like protein
VREAYAGYDRGDIADVIDVLAPDIEWSEPIVPGMPGSGTHRGRDSVKRDIFGRLGENWDVFRVMPEEFYDAGSTILVCGRMQLRSCATGNEVESPFAHVWTMRDGQVVRFRDFFDSFQVGAAAGVEAAA